MVLAGKSGTVSALIPSMISRSGHRQLKRRTCILGLSELMISPNPWTPLHFFHPFLSFLVLCVFCQVSTDRWPKCEASAKHWNTSKSAPSYSSKLNKALPKSVFTLWYHKASGHFWPTWRISLSFFPHYYTLFSMRKCCLRMPSFGMRGNMFHEISICFCEKCSPCNVWICAWWNSWIEECGFSPLEWVWPTPVSQFSILLLSFWVKT